MIAGIDAILEAVEEQVASMTRRVPAWSTSTSTAATA